MDFSNIIDKTVLGAIIAATASVIAATIAFVGLLRQKKHESHLKQRQLQEVIYSELLLSLQAVMNSKNPNEKFEEFQKQCVKCFAHGDNHVSMHVLEYFKQLVKSANTNEPLSGLAHEKYQTAIINSIRNAQGLKPLGSISLVKFTFGN